jgi:hypothetical protein
VGWARGALWQLARLRLSLASLLASGDGRALSFSAPRLLFLSLLCPTLPSHRRARSGARLSSASNPVYPTCHVVRGYPHRRLICPADMCACRPRGVSSPRRARRAIPTRLQAFPSATPDLVCRTLAGAQLHRIRALRRCLCSLCLLSVRVFSLAARRVLLLCSFCITGAGRQRGVAEKGEPSFGATPKKRGTSFSACSACRVRSGARRRSSCPLFSPPALSSLCFLRSLSTLGGPCPLWVGAHPFRK